MNLRRVILIANPKGGVGNNASLAAKAETFLSDHAIETRVLFTKHAGHAREIVEQLECREGDAICGVGGDGTMHELVNGLMNRNAESRVLLTLLPGGTGNSFLQDLSCLDPAEVLSRMMGQTSRFVDLFEVTIGGTTRYGFNIVGWGLMSSANQLAESMRWLGRRRYDVAALAHLFINRRYPATLKVDGETIEDEFTLLAACNTIHTGEGMMLAPKAVLDDGKLDLLYLKKATRLDMLRMFAKLGKGKHLGAPGIHYQQVSSLTLTTDASLPINVDGELIGSGSFSVRILPGALEVLL
ncbi:diacylglycerol kinase family lipid kinase [Verrucomicrobiales bacterium]|jgi:sphingosine kinase|nr:diacylglycerol kinase family lipid kinase [Verrucomicrobiales bacterium]MDA7614586.1 diacylglycerol kinase family lipid kinase [Verrucomicrobiales bacterium]MDA7644005.1 diacylglycerol kinase family lipid kinase [Verrucomicrobiales bacterium]MDB2346563.1 diacylglycerol kinase family lipid kinase [Verrucomicrobiales bacterium]